MKTKTVLEVSRDIGISKEVINYRCRALGFNRKKDQKRVLNISEIEQIIKFNNRNDFKKLKKYSNKKIMIIEFFIMNNNNSSVEIAEKLWLSLNFVTNTINEYLQNNTITVASKL